MMDLDGIYMDLYGTITAGDRDAVEAVCENIVRSCDPPITAQALSIKWGECFLHYIDSCNGKSFRTLYEVEILTLKKTMSQLGRRINPHPFIEQLREYWRAPPLQRDARRFLEECHHPVCLVTNADQSDVDEMLDRCGLQFSCVVTSEESRSYKPDARIFDLALEKTGWRRDRVIHVGDSLHSDVGGAIAAGIRSGWVNRTHRIHDIGNHRPDHEFEDLFGLSALLERPQGHRDHIGRRQQP